MLGAQATSRASLSGMKEVLPPDVSEIDFSVRSNIKKIYADNLSAMPCTCHNNYCPPKATCVVLQTWVAQQGVSWIAEVEFSYTTI